ncbi:craniofacial development protein 2-like [Cylas formicarius]|uniref:craniofacial development protein 2-like n=1 Tax=Cylas formicarius TaxID=197179 RepID=UPI0029583582|nr:craniofacial development protein 2-like [Cylas formicarius]
MGRLGIQILGLSEVRWPGSGITRAMNKILYYSGNNDSKHHNGVRVILGKGYSQAVTNFLPVSDRNLLIQLSGKPMNINIIQTYAPTADKSTDELEAWYTKLEELIKVTKKQDLTVIMGDFNAKIGQGRVSDLVGEFGLGDRNDRGERLIEFCQQHNMAVTNTWFKHHPRRLYTWTSPQHTNTRTVRNQIDFIIINKRFHNSVTNVKTYSGADIGSDHSPVIARVRPKWKIIKRPKPPGKPDVGLLMDVTIKQKVSQELNEHLANASRDLALTTDVDSTWKAIKDILNGSVEANLKPTPKRNRREWMTGEILNLMDSRRECKAANDINKYRHLNRIIRTKIKSAKEHWIEDRCSEIEELQGRYDHFNLHKKTPQREKYFKNLFVIARAEPYQTDMNAEEPSILKTEVEYAIKQLKANKSPGPDEILPEILKLISEENIDLLVALYNRIYETGKIPQEWLESIFIPLAKKTNPKDCGDFRLISLMSHALKVLLKIIHNRISSKCEANIADDQFGFRSEMGTREALFSLLVLAQKCYDQQRDIFICFIDFEKAFDRV